ncbi:hypothetical protein H8B06_10300 [Sphingobacterium sp. DN00404]|uniref:Uncharacterized protein n=1 Tax=Sphingobacterium micropteri TaxID=2763501 RepID=A0ABR7YPF4_9SPHI|nr:hypothetical protein [Sphingobacterium micropteri]MBD1433218.1 hypothetical protein [Sphingobacterium micropteri]
MMKKIVFILISGLLLLILFSCKRDEHQEPEEPTFPFMKVGNQWNYRLITEAGETEISYMIADKTKQNYFKVLLNFVGSELPAVDHFWYADQQTFTMATEWPDSDLKFTMLEKAAKVDDRWEYFVPAPLNPENDDLSGTITYEVIAVNATTIAIGKTFTDVYKVRHTASSHPQFYADYFISLSSGIIKMEGMGYVRIDDDEIAYFPLEWQLKSKNF